VTDIFEQAPQSMRRGELAEAHGARLADVCGRADVVPGAYDARILASLAGYEP
jgi:hypothetical protein